MTATTSTYRFDHAAYLRNVAFNAPLVYKVAAFCLVCEEPILPPCANRGIEICPDCRATPEYLQTFAR